MMALQYDAVCATNPSLQGEEMPDDTVLPTAEIHDVPL
jgi:hypothetical protein